jgi:hypothetical protein
MATKKMMIVVDGAGKILAAAHSGTPKKGQPTSGIYALPGQTIHEVDVPEEIANLESGHLFHCAMAQATFVPSGGTLKFKPVKVKKLKHKS